MSGYGGLWWVMGIVLGLGFTTASQAGTYSIVATGNSSVSDQFSFTVCAYVDADCGTASASGCKEWVNSGSGPVTASIPAGPNVCLALQVQQPTGYSKLGINLNQDSYWLPTCESSSVTATATTGWLAGSVPSGIYAVISSPAANLTLTLDITLNSWDKSSGEKVYSNRSFIVDCSVNHNSPQKPI